MTLPAVYTYTPTVLPYPEQADDADEVQRLDGMLAARRPWLTWYDSYFQGMQALQFMVPALIEELGDRVTSLVINWPRLGAKAYENRLDIEGFRYKGDAKLDEDLSNVWQANNMDEQSQQGHLEALILGRSYVIVGAGDTDDDYPLVTVESPFQVFAARDPRTRRISSAVKRWVEDDGTQQAVLYRPGRTVPMTWARDGWTPGRVDRHDLGRVPVVPLVNEPRLLYPDGISEFHDVLPLADAANKMATDMMVSGEYHAMPRRWVFGMKAEDFVDSTGKQKSPWSAIAGRLWASEEKDVKVGQFQESDLAVFHNTIRMIATLVTHLLALPQDYMSFTSDNPSSADAIRASESPFVKRVERKHTYLGGAWEDVNRLVLRLTSGEWDPRAESLETKWGDPATPTVAQKADATMKLVAAGVIPIAQAREDLGYTDEQIRRMAEMDDKASVDPITSALLRGVNPEPPVAAEGV